RNVTGVQTCALPIYGTVRVDYRFCTSYRTNSVGLHRRILAVALPLYYYCAARSTEYRLCVFLYAERYRTDQSKSRYPVDCYVHFRLWRFAVRLLSRRSQRLDELRGNRADSWRVSNCLSLCPQAVYFGSADT